MHRYMRLFSINLGRMIALRPWKGALGFLLGEPRCASPYRRFNWDSQSPDTSSRSVGTIPVALNPPAGSFPFAAING